MSDVNTERTSHPLQKILKIERMIMNVGMEVWHIDPEQKTPKYQWTV